MYGMWVCGNIDRNLNNQHLTQRGMKKTDESGLELSLEEDVIRFLRQQGKITSAYILMQYLDNR